MIQIRVLPVYTFVGQVRLGQVDLYYHSTHVLLYRGTIFSTMVLHRLLLQMHKDLKSPTRERHNRTINTYIIAQGLLHH